MWTHRGPPLSVLYLVFAAFAGSISAVGPVAFGSDDGDDFLGICFGNLVDGDVSSPSFCISLTTSLLVPFSKSSFDNKPTGLDTTCCGMAPVVDEDVTDVGASY